MTDKSINASNAVLKADSGAIFAPESDGSCFPCPRFRGRPYFSVKNDGTLCINAKDCLLKADHGI